MDPGPSQKDASNPSPRKQNLNSDHDGGIRASSPSIDPFNESQCLFCNQTSPDLAQNTAHMKTHGLYVDPTNLLVDVSTLLAYFHLLISGYCECLYCGTQRNTPQGVQQHMIGKGHCKYDLSDEDSELRDFFDSPAPDDLTLPTKRISDDSHLPSKARSRKSRPPNFSDRDKSADGTGLSQRSPSSTTNFPTKAEAASDVANTDSATSQLSVRAQKQASTLNNQLSHLRAADRRSLLHLPTAQQRAILATHHKQMEKARRSEQTQRGHLESAGNHFSRLGTTRLIRQPPHFGGVSSLNR